MAATTQATILPYNKAKEYVNQLQLGNLAQWAHFSSSPDYPGFLPKEPHEYYANLNQWKGWNDFLGGILPTPPKAKYSNFMENLMKSKASGNA